MGHLCSVFFNYWCAHVQPHLTLNQSWWRNRPISDEARPFLQAARPPRRHVSCSQIPANMIQVWCFGRQSAELWLASVTPAFFVFMISVPSDRTTWWISLPNPSGLVFLPLPRRVAVCVQWSLHVGERYESRNIWIILCMCVLLIRVLCEFACWHLHQNKLLRVRNCFQKNTDK